MSKFKRAKVVMLPTNSEVINQVGDICEFDYGLNIAMRDDIGYPVRHLSITSDDEIKEGDWFLDTNVNTVFQAKWDIKNDLNQEYKIIATTDTSLKLLTCDDCNIDKDYRHNFSVCKCKLPQPSQSFIEVFVREYNKGNVITDVLVEYEEIEGCLYDFPKECEYSECRVLDKCHKEIKLKTKLSKLKINPKDNTITIKKVKDSWDRDEVKQLLIKCCGEVYSEDGILKGKSPSELCKWIEENL